MITVMIGRFGLIVEYISTGTNVFSKVYLVGYRFFYISDGRVGCGSHYRSHNITIAVSIASAATPIIA